ncbi:MAG: hypothetical protein IIY06_11655 [Proteobacteria bacterium]|nr:hypothetical protein [Pseudomonadota bacterium]
MIAKRVSVHAEGIEHLDRRIIAVRFGYDLGYAKIVTAANDEVWRVGL